MRAWRWQLEVLALRHGLWLLPGLLLLLAAAAAWLLWLPAQRASLLEAAQALTRQRAQSLAAGKPLAQARPRLPPTALANENLGRLFTLARQYGLTIAQADYRRQGSAPVGRWQIQVPATGSYPQVRYFLRAAQALPGVSLDEISLNQGGAAGPVEARMLFSIWYDAGGSRP